mmetsp:Transcript_4921/g.7413  ORF Transcript_4921/g.7413 Transcript_4921/m.7413 type:complete len:275 (-) Transcript_4921:418-1242(-)
MNRDDHDLSWTDPERPLSTPMLTENGEHTLDTSQHGTMDHNWTFELLALLLRTGVVLQVKTDWKLEVKLNSCTLVNAFHGIHDLDINLGTIKRSITGILPPISLTSKFVHRVCQSSLGTIPKLLFTKSLRWSGGKFKLVSHSKSGVHFFHKIESPEDLFLDLIFTAVDVSIILHKTSDTGESSQCTAQLVSVQDTKVGQTKWQVTVRADGIAKYETMSGTVHWFHGPLSSFNIETKHGILVMQSVTRLMPQVKIENIRSDNFIISTFPVVLLDE